MWIIELLKKESIELGVKVSDKEEAADRLVSLMDAGGRLKDTAGYKEGMPARETLGSATIGEGIAIPHAKVEAVKGPGLAVMAVPEGVDYGTFDGSLANLPSMIAAPAEGADVHLEALPCLSTLLVNPGFKEGLIGAADKDEFLCIIDEVETERFGAPEGKAVKDIKADTEAGTSSGYRVLAVAACSTDIAHTYMAVENSENTGKKPGIALKVETDGSGGAQNVLTREEIAAADAIIIAVDKSVEMVRFDGKPVIMVPVVGGIHKAEELIKRVMNGTVPVYHHTGAAGREPVLEGNDSIGRTVYKRLTNGILHVLPFVTDGGILIVLAFLFDDYSINPANSGKNTPLAAYFKTVGEQAFGMMFPILAGSIVMSIADCPDLVVGLVAGLIAKTGPTSVNPIGGDVNAGFLGVLFAGFVGGYIVVGSRKLFSKLLKSLEGIKSVLPYPIIGISLAAVVTIFISPYMGVINDGPTHFLSGVSGTSRIVLGMVLDGMMSADMGGPFNKAAYVSGTAQLAEDSFEIMAAVMAGGMVSPIAVTLCTIFLKSKFTEKERQPGTVSYITGLSLITEGVILFVTQDPLRVIPSRIIGSAIARELSMVFGCIPRAPHGGIFVLPTIGNHLMYLAAVVVGATAGCMILGMLKKNAAQ